MSKVRVLVGTRKGAFILTSDGKRENWERQRASLRGLGDVSPERLARRPQSHLRLADQRLVRADHPALRRRRQDLGDARRRPESRLGRAHRARATSSSTTLQRKPARRSPRISGMTARSIRGSSSASGIWSRRSPIPTRFTPESKTRRCSARPTAARTGRNCRACAATAPAQVAAGRRRHVPAHHHSRPQRILIASSSPFRPRAPSAPTTAASHGSRSIAASIRNTSPTREPRSATAFITLP